LEFTNTHVSQKLIKGKTISEGGKYRLSLFYNGYEIRVFGKRVFGYTLF